MFLFTNNSAVEAAAPAQRGQPVSQALKNAATETGVSFDYLLRTANRESSLNPEAEASTSSASGLFQFVEQTWLGLVKNEGERVGLSNAAQYITEVAPGRYTVSDPQARQAILDMRKDPELASKMAGIFTSQNRSQLSRAIGREPNAGELYIAHFLGASGGAGLIQLASQSPEAPAASYFPEAAAANRSIFYSNGQARSAGEVYANLVGRHGGSVPLSGLPPLEQAYAPEMNGVDVNSNGTWSGFKAKKESGTGGLFDLYRTDGAPVSNAIERVWTRRAIDGEQAGDFALRSTLPADPSAGVAAPISLLPPKRLEARSAKPMPLPDEPETQKKRSDKKADLIGEPLDLLKFMRMKG